MRRATAAALVLLTGVARANAWIDVTSCGTHIPPLEIGVLRADLTCGFRCSDDPSVACLSDGDCPSRADNTCLGEHITLGRGARLELSGHVLTMAYHDYGVACDAPDTGYGSCTVRGPGTILGGKGTGVFSRAMSVRVVDVAIENTDAAVVSSGWVLLKRVRLGAREEGVYGVQGVVARDVTVGPAGISSGGDLVLRNVSVPETGGPITAAGVVRGADVDTFGFELIAGRHVALRRVRSRPAYPDSPDELVTIRATGRLRLADSQVGSLESGEPPWLIRTACLRSMMAGGAGTWGVCAGD